MLFFIKKRHCCPMASNAIRVSADGSGKPVPSISEGEVGVAVWCPGKGRGCYALIFLPGGYLFFLGGAVQRPGFL